MNQIRFQSSIKVTCIITIISLFISFSLFSCGGCGGGGGSSTDTNGNSSTNSATLTWDPPTTNADGTPLTDLAGYKIYYGTSPGNYITTIDAGCAPCSSSCPGTGQTTVCTYIVQNLTPGTYYFAVTVYETSRNEGGYSNEVSKTIN